MVRSDNLDDDDDSSPVEDDVKITLSFFRNIHLYNLHTCIIIICIYINIHYHQQTYIILINIYTSYIIIINIYYICMFVAVKSKSDAQLIKISSLVTEAQVTKQYLSTINRYQYHHNHHHHSHHHHHYDNIMYHHYHYDNLMYHHHHYDILMYHHHHYDNLMYHHHHYDNLMYHHHHHNHIHHPPNSYRI